MVFRLAGSACSDASVSPKPSLSAMPSGRRNIAEWLRYIHVAARYRQDPILSILLAMQLLLIFIAEPIASNHIMLPLKVLLGLAPGPIRAGRASL